MQDHAGRDVWRNRNCCVGNWVGNGGANEKPRRPTARAARTRRRGGLGPARGGIRPRKARISKMRCQGDAAAAPTYPAAPPWDCGGCGGVWLPRAEGLARDDKRVGHRAGQERVGGRGSVQAFAVSEPARAGFQRE